MLKSENGDQFYPKEEEEKNENSKKPNISLNLDLNVIKETEENIRNNEEDHLSEEESLGYNSNYKIYQNNSTSKENINSKDKTSKRKASTLSTAISQTDTFSETNLFLPPNNLKSQNNDRKASYTQPPHIFFGRERLNSTPITTYFEGLEFYLRELQPEKNEYQKSNNYIEKEIFFKERNISFKDNKYKSFDMAEQKQFNSNHILKNLEEKYNKASADKKVSSSINIENYKHSTDNKMQTSIPLQISLENNIKKQNSINNNYHNSFTPMIQKFNNCLYGKFDMPMYYFGYYNIDSKYIFEF